MLSSGMKKVKLTCVLASDKERNSTVKDEYDLVPGFYLNRSVDQMILPNRGCRTFEVRENAQSETVFDVKPPKDSDLKNYCCILGIKGNRGPYTAHCRNLDAGDDRDPVQIVIIVIVSCFLVVAVASVLAVWAYKKHLVFCSYEKWLKNNSKRRDVGVKDEILEDPPFLHNFMEQTRPPSEIIEVSWLPDSAEKRARFRREQIDSGFQDYECDKAPNHELRNDTEEVEADDSGNCDLNRSIDSEESNQNQGNDLTSEENDSSSECLVKNDRREAENEPLVSNHIEIPLSPTAQSGVYFSA